MNTTNTKNQDKLAKVLKSNIAKAWYQLDPKSYQNWLEGRRAAKKELAA